ncbi:MAG: hypothetical protein IPO27_12780 [Bacteroidetes bacterium]|nr:hypothetical protein [Bacteroidota bacterium]
MRFKISIMSCIVLATTQLVQAQSIMLTPRLKVGEKKQVTITDLGKEFKRDKWHEEEPDERTYRYEVTGEDAEGFTFTIIDANPVAALGRKLGDTSLTGSVSEIESKIIYRLNKKDGTTELLNWGEIQGNTNAVFAKLDSAMSKGDDEENSKSALLKMIFDPLKSVYESEESIKESMDKDNGIIFSHYGKMLNFADTLFEENNEQNPFKKGALLTGTSKSILKKGATENKYELVRITNYDMAEFIEGFKKMMKEMIEKMGSSDKKKKELEEIQTMKFDFNTTENITIDSTSGAMIEALMVSTIKGSAGGKNNEKIITRKIQVL